MENTPSSFIDNNFRYQAVVIVDNASNQFADSATLKLGDETWTLVKKEFWDGKYWGFFASDPVKVKLSSPAELTKDPDNTNPYISWHVDGKAQKYDILVSNETPGYGGRTATVTVAATDPALVVSGDKATYNIGAPLGQATCKDGDNWFIVTVQAIAPDGYADSEVASSPTSSGQQWLFNMVKTLKVNLDDETGVFSWDPYAYDEARYYKYWLTYGAQEGKQFVDGYFDKSKTSMNMDAYIEQFNHAQAGDYWVHMYATTWDGHQLTRESVRKYSYTPKIKAISFDGVASPMVGEHAKAPLNSYSVQEEHVRTMTLSEGSAYWRRYAGGAWEVMSDAETFQTGGQYLISIPIRYDEGYKLVANPTVKVNGEPVTATVDDYGNGKARVDCQMNLIARNDNVYVVTAGALNVRANASAAAERIGGLSYGDVVQARGESNGFVMIDYEGQTGWAAVSYLKLTESESTAFVDGPVKYTLYAGAMNVRSTPEQLSDNSNRIGEVSNGKEVLATGAVTNADGSVWITMDYYSDTEPELGHRLGYILFSKPNGSGGTTYYFTTDHTEPTKAPGKDNAPTDELVIDTGTYPKVTFAPYKKSAIATGDTTSVTATLTDENFLNNDDGYLLTTIYPEDGLNFDSLTADKIALPAEFTARGMVVLGLTKNADGSIDVKIGPKDPVTVTFETNGGSAVTSKTVSAGGMVFRPADPVKDGFTFVDWFEDAGFTKLHSFEDAVTADMTLYARWLGYAFSKGANGTWTRGSADGHELVVNRSFDDDTTFGLFMGLSVDGVDVDPANYAATAGSLNVVLSAAYLETLPAGEHTVKASFRDGAAERTLTIADAKVDAKTRPSSAVPATGDKAPIGTLATLAALSLVALAVSARRLRASR